MHVFLLTLVFIAVSVGLAWFLLARDEGEREPIGALWLAVGLGFVGALMTMWLEGIFVDDNSLVAGVPTPLILQAALTVGIIEEFCKFVPLAFFIYKRRYFNEHTDGVLYFALAGLGFGLPENILYTVQYGGETGVARLFLTPLFHAAATGIVGYFLIKRKLAKKQPWGIVLPLGIAMVLHGLYNFGLVSGINIYILVSLIISLGLTVGLFMVAVRARELDQDRGLSTVGHNSYCRSCGQANPQHHLYCTHCGHHA